MNENNTPGTIAVNGGHFRLNEPAVITDIIDGDAIIMHLERGSYCSLDPIGSEIWRQIIAGTNVADVTSMLADHFQQDLSKIAQDIAQLVTQWLELDLIRPEEKLKADGAKPSAPKISSHDYQTPQCSVYSDMKHLLALDPPIPEFRPEEP